MTNYCVCEKPIVNVPRRANQICILCGGIITKNKSLFKSLKKEGDTIGGKSLIRSWDSREIEKRLEEEEETQKKTKGLLESLK